ncbi:sensor histidine kinase [Trichloromonas sp.]|uniref:sensor histidine kinase n=1 Tax=Trichloromonas sp. TaxID=3069249 RepID=UPI003D818B9A
MDTFLYSRTGRLTKSLFLAFLIALLCLFSKAPDLLQDALPFALLAGYYLVTDRRFTIEQIQSSGLMVAHVGVYLLLCTLVIWATTGDEESVYWIVYFLPIAVAASNLNLRLTLLTCTVAVLLFFSQVPSRLYLDPELRQEEIPEFLIFGVTFFIVGLLVQSFSEIHRRQLQSQRHLNEQLLANQAALQESLARLGEAEESLRRKERLAALGEMSAGIAHEIRNPLGIISSSAQLIEKKLAAGSSDVGQLLDIIQEESTRINGLVTDFISFGRPGEPVLRPYDLQAFLQRAAEHVDGLARQRNVAVEVEPEGGALTIRFDADMMQQVLLNLLLNALAAIEPGGRIRLRSYREEGRVCFEVEDDGCGIAPENQEKVFDPFFTTRDKGTGLGLANAFRIVEAHCGDLRMRSELGRGSVFTVCLPAEEE